jgi:SdrD B-like domain
MRLQAVMRQRAICIALQLVLSSGLAWSQTSVTPSSSSLTLSPQPYQDKLIEGSFSPDPSEAADQAYNREGLPRGYSIETSWDQRGVSSQTQVFGLRATGFMDTLYWGSFSGQLGLQQGRASQAGSASSSSQQTQWQIRQQGMPLDGSWRLDNSLGQITLPVPELARNSLRFGLPTAGMLGISSQWRQAAGLQINAAVGKSGEFSGFPVTSFQTTGGSYAYLSAQDRLSFGAGTDASRWLYGATLASAQNMPANSLGAVAGNARLNAQSLYLAAQRQWPSSQGLAAPASSVQINLLHSQNNAPSISGASKTSAQGIWLDGSFRLSGHANQWGLFHLQPRLSWLDANVASDLQGGYWRHSWRTRQWSTESNLELLQPVQGRTPAGFFATQSLRYQYSTVMSFGASFNLSRYNTDGESLLVYGQWAHGLGTTRAQLEWAKAEPADKLIRMQLDHELEANADLRFATSLSIDHEKRNGLPTRGFGLALSADWQLAPNFSFTQNLQTRSSGGQVQYTLNTGISWRFAPQWSLNATVFGVQGNPQAGSLVQSPLTAPSVSGRNLQDKGVFISLRYTQAAGSSQAPIGGSPGSAAGSVQGVIFLDENGNGKQEASERGAAQITVQLNGRFSVDTDAQGRFEFPYVAAGAHTIQVVSDNLPLPWALAGEGKQTIRVNTRDQVRVVFGAVKQ